MPMDWGEDRNDKNERLIHAAMVGDLATVKLLFRDPEIDASWVHHVVFLRACAKGRVELVRLLLSSNLPTGVLNATGKHSNPFLEACVHNRTEVVELLLSDPRINPNIKDHQGRSALFFAVYKGNEDMIKQLISSPEYLMSTPDELDELRDIAAMEDHEDCLYLLEEYYADREATVKKYRKELEYGKVSSGRLYSLMVYVTDGYLRASSHSTPNQVRFFGIGGKLPIEMQMIVANRAFGESASIVRFKDSENGFDRYSK